MNPSVDAFVQSLIDAKMGDHRAINPYADPVRAENLRRWLALVDQSSVTALFIGEAPGKHGAALTGIPFVSPNLMTSLDSELWQLTYGSYRVPSEVDPQHREATATIFWRHVSFAFKDLPPPLTWNAYPFWPIEVDHGGEESNRKPTKHELKKGTKWLRKIVAMFPELLPVAVGRVAQDACNSIGVASIGIRHPSFGGASEFAKGVNLVADKLRRLC